MTINNPMAGAQPPRPPRPWYKRWWVWVIAAAALIFVVLPVSLVAAIIATGDYEDTSPTEAAAVESSEPSTTDAAEEPTEEPAPTPTPEATPDPSPEIEAEPSDDPETEQGLAERVEAALLTSNGIGSFRELSASSPGFYIAELEDVGSSTVRMHVQTQLADNDERDQFARWLYNHACSAVPELDTVVVRDLGGRDHNWYASRTVTACG